MKTPLPATAELRYRAALEQIAALANATEVRGPLEDIGVPDHKVKDGGWVPIHPRLKDGLCYAAKIAGAALAESQVSRCEISGKLLAEVLVMYGVVQSAAIDDPDGYDGYATMNHIHEAAKYLQDRMEKSKESARQETDFLLECAQQKGKPRRPTRERKNR